jgi:hypothetical protein
MLFVFIQNLERLLELHYLGISDSVPTWRVDVHFSLFIDHRIDQHVGRHAALCRPAQIRPLSVNHPYLSSAGHQRDRTMIIMLCS